MSEMTPEQGRRAAQEHALKEAAILESIPEYVARLESLREVYGPGGDAARHYAQLKATLLQLATMRAQLEARTGELDVDIGVAEKKFKDLCVQVGALSDTSVVVNSDSVKDDVFHATQQLGKLQKRRELVGLSLEQCLDDTRSTEQALATLSQQRRGKVSTALLLAARLNEVLESFKDVSEINYQPVVDPTLSVDDYSALVQNQPRNASTINWASGVFDDAMQQIEASNDVKLRDAANKSSVRESMATGADEGWDEELTISPEMLRMLKGNEG